MVKIVYVVPRLNNAGPINQVYNLISNLDRKKFNVHIITMYQELEESRKADFEILKIPIKCLKLKHKCFSFIAINRINKLLKEIQPEIVHSETLPADILISSVSRNFKWCTTIHCNIYNDYLLRFPKEIAKPLIFLHSRCLKKTDKLISCSITLQKFYFQKGLETIAIQNGVDTNKYCLDTVHDSNYWRNKIGLPYDKRIIIVVGSIDYRKRSLFIVNALKNYLKENNIKLIFCGVGADLTACKKASKGYDIEFRGKIIDVVPYLNAVDLYLSASSSEGLPMSVIEAGCCGLPMVLSDIEQHKELIMEGTSVRGIEFAQLDNEIEFVNAVKHVLYMDIDKKKITDYFQNSFSALIMANKYQNVYSKLKMENKE